MIGLCEVPIGALIGPEEENGLRKPLRGIEFWENVRAGNNKLMGHLRLRTDFYPIASTASRSKTEAATGGETLNGETGLSGDANATESKSLAEYDSGILRIFIESARGLIKHENVFVELLLNNNERNIVHRTKKKNSETPYWGEFAEVFVKEIQYSKFSALLRCQTDNEKAMLLGRWTSRVSDLVAPLSKDGEWYKVGTGEVKLAFEFSPVEITIDPSESMANMGQLKVDALSASNLPAVDSSGTSDPYIVFTLDEVKVYKTETIKKSLNPQFNETFTIEIDQRSTARLCAEVYDWNQFQARKMLGECLIDLSTLVPEVPLERNYPLNQGRAGYLRLRITFTPEDICAKDPEKGIKNLARTATGLPKQAVGGVLKGMGTVGGGFGRGVGVGAAKPPGVLSAAVTSGGNVVTNVTNIADYMRTPFTAGKSKAEPKDSLNAPISEEIIPQANSSLSRSLDPASLSNTSLLQDTPIPHTTLASNETTDLDDDKEVGDLLVTIIEAQGLKAVDSNGMSDPFIKVYFDRKNVYKTKVIKKNLNPQWNERVRIPRIKGRSHSLVFNVRDYNYLSHSVSLGDFALSVSDYISPDQKVAEIALKPLNEKYCGTLFLRLEFLPINGISAGGSDAGNEFDKESIISGGRHRRKFSLGLRRKRSGNVKV